MNENSYRPVPKMVAAALGGALATLLVWLLGAFSDVDVTSEAAAALTAVLGFAAGYLKSPAEDEQGDFGAVSVVEALLVVFIVVVVLVLLGVV